MDDIKLTTGSMLEKLILDIEKTVINAKEWNETWFGNNQKINVKKSTDNIPEFLKTR